jgi:hypothetical protein
VSLIIEEGDASTDFSRRIRPTEEFTPRGEPLPSVMAGAPSIALGFVCLAALLGMGAESIPGVVKRATIIEQPFNGYGGRSTPGEWFVPDGGFFVLTFSALMISSIGILLSRRRGRPITSVVGFALNTFALVSGYVLTAAEFFQ